LNEEEEEEGEDEEESILVPDPEFAGFPSHALLDPANWVHHHQYIFSFFI
jgi:Radial spokehead-like protein